MHRTPRTNRWSALVAGVVATALALSACGGDDDDATPAAATDAPATDAPADDDPDGATAPPSVGTGAAPAEGASGTLVVAIDRDPGYLDPFHVQNNAGRSVAQAMFDTLVMSIDGEYVPTLAERYTVVDDTTIEFTLRDGITFHNGEPLDSAAIAYNIERMLDPAVDSHYLPQFEGVSIEVVDDLNFVLRLAEPDANIIDTLTYLFIVPPAYAAEVGPEGFNQAPVGTGPFTFVSYTADDRVVVAANPNYWEDSPKGAPRVETVEFRAIPEATTRVAELTAGDVDIAFGLAPDQIGSVESAGATVVTYSDLSIHFIQINTAGIGSIAEEATGADAVGFEALADPRVRTALNLAIDREAVAEELFAGFASPLGQPFGPGGPLSPTEDMQYGYDPDRARALLAEAGYGEGLTLDMMASGSVSTDLLSLVASYFEAIGVSVEIEVIEAATFNDGWVAGQFPHLRFATWSNPEQALELLIQSGDLISTYSNPTVDELIDLQATQVDPAQRKATIDELTRVMHEDAAWVFLWSTDAIVGLAPGVSGWVPHTAHVPVANVTVAD